MILYYGIYENIYNSLVERLRCNSPTLSVLHEVEKSITCAFLRW